MDCYASEYGPLNTDYTKKIMSVLAGFADYRTNPITVTLNADNTFHVEVTFTISLVVNSTGVDMDMEAMAIDWCNLHYPVEPFEGFFTIRHANWHGNTLIMTIENTNNTFAYELEYEIKTMPLEDTVYEGGVEDNFWLIPLSFVRDWSEDE